MQNNSLTSGMREISLIVMRPADNKIHNVKKINCFCVVRSQLLFILEYRDWNRGYPSKTDNNFMNFPIFLKTWGLPRGKMEHIRNSPHSDIVIDNKIITDV